VLPQGLVSSFKIDSDAADSALTGGPCADDLPGVRNEWEIVAATGAAANFETGEIEIAAANADKGRRIFIRTYL